MARTQRRVKQLTSQLAEFKARQEDRLRRQRLQNERALKAQLSSFPLRSSTTTTSNNSTTASQLPSPVTAPSLAPVAEPSSLQISTAPAISTQPSAQQPLVSQLTDQELVLISRLRSGALRLEDLQPAMLPPNLSTTMADSQHTQVSVTLIPLAQPAPAKSPMKSPPITQPAASTTPPQTLETYSPLSVPVDLNPLNSSAEPPLPQPMFASPAPRHNPHDDDLVEQLSPLLLQRLRPSNASQASTTTATAVQPETQQFSHLNQRLASLESRLAQLRQPSVNVSQRSARHVTELNSITPKRSSVHDDDDDIINLLNVHR